MKDEKRNIEKIAQQIVEIEKQRNNDIENEKKYILQMIQLIESLSLEELIKIDEYIIEKNLLTK